MTKDDANAIMFAYRYDNLTISESLFKQMIGDIAIMRNPWPIFSIAALSGAACLIYDHFFSYETMWIAVVVFLALLALCFFAYCKYEHWLAKKLNPVPFPVSWTVKMKKKQKETQDILSYHSQAAGCSDKARAKASGGRQPIEECGRTGL